MSDGINERTFESFEAFPFFLAASSALLWLVQLKGRKQHHSTMEATSEKYYE